jgi:essential nuclear protein 1
MGRYKSGKIPKALKVIPTLRNWQDILALTVPQNWTPNAMFEATTIFSSSLLPKLVEV